MHLPEGHKNDQLDGQQLVQGLHRFEDLPILKLLIVLLVKLLLVLKNDLIEIDSKRMPGVAPNLFGNIVALKRENTEHVNGHRTAALCPFEDLHSMND